MRLRWLIGFVVLAAAAQTPQRNPAADWPMYNRDLAATRFSPLNQINARNVGRLQLAWTYKVGKVSAEGISGGNEFTPIVVNGMMYLVTGSNIVALEPETGKEIWNYALKNGEPSRRGA